MSDLAIFCKAMELIESGQRFAFASILRSLGSTPQKAGANAIFAADGRIWGTLGGGCLEAECRRQAMDSLDTESAQIFDLKLDDIRGWDDGLICGGRVQVLIHPRPDKNRTAYKALLSARQKRLSGALLTFLQHADREMGKAEFVPESELKDWLDEDEIPKGSEPICAKKAECFVEPFRSLPRLIIAGAGHIGKATAHFASLVGFEIIVVDDRPALVSRENLPDSNQTICGDIPAEMARMETDPNTYIVIVTRGHRHDGKVLAAVIDKPAAFIGMIGSRRKGRMIRHGLLEKGLATKAALDRVCCPIGVDIGSLSVQEIALSITAQIVAVRRKGKWDAPAMKNAFEDHRHRPRSRTITTDGAPQAAPSLGQ